MRSRRWVRHERRMRLRLRSPLTSACPAHAPCAVYFRDVFVGGIGCRVENIEDSTTDKKLYIMTLGVLAPYRGQGIGEYPGCGHVDVRLCFCACAGALLSQPRAHWCPSLLALLQVHASCTVCWRQRGCPSLRT